MGLLEVYKKISPAFGLHGGKVDNLSFGGLFEILTKSDKSRGEVDVRKTCIVVDEILK